MKTKICVAVVLAIALMLVLVNLTSDGPAHQQTTGTAGSATPAGLALQDPGNGSAPSDQRTPVAAVELDSGSSSQSSPTDADSAALPTGDVSWAQVVDIEGAAVAAAPVTLVARVGTELRPTYVEPQQIAVSDEQGYFEMPPLSRAGRLIATAPRYVTLLDLQVPGAPLWDATIVVAERRRYSGLVTDEKGEPLESVDIAVKMDAGLLRSLRPGVPLTQTPAWSTVSDAEGHFEIADVGWSDGLVLSATRSGYRTEELVLEPPGTEDDGQELVIQLQRVHADTRSIVGRVLDADGQVIVGATVFYGKRIMTSDHEGRFVFQREDSDTGKPQGEIVAAKHGLLPATRVLDETIDTSSQEIELVLEGMPLSIAGQVVDAHGEPVADAHVWTIDAKRVGEWPTTVEGTIGEQGDAVESGLHRSTDADGRFELIGLLDHPYRLFVSNPATLQVVERPGCTPGAPLLIRLDDKIEPTRTVSGRAMSLGGEPVAGVRIFVGRLAPLMVKGRRLYVPLQTRGTPVTDDNGEFRFEGLCIDGTYLLPAMNDSPGMEQIHLEQVKQLESIEILVPRTCRLQVLLENEIEGATHIRVQDEDDHTLRLRVDKDGRVTTSGLARLVDGKTDVLMVDERARSIVLFKDRQELRRIPIRLTPGEVQVIR